MKTTTFLGVMLGFLVATPGIYGINAKNDAGQLVVNRQQKLILEAYWPPIQETSKFVLPTSGKKQIQRISKKHQSAVIFNNHVNNFSLKTAGATAGVVARPKKPP